MSITIEGRLLENVFTTAQWAATTVILKDRVWGHEVDNSGLPVGSKMGNGVDLWAALPYWYGKGTIADPISIPTGSDYPFTVDYSTLITTYGETPTPLFYDALTGNKRLWTDCYITFSGTNMLVYCHTNDGTTTSDDMYLILKV